MALRFRRQHHFESANMHFHYFRGSRFGAVWQRLGALATADGTKVTSKVIQKQCTMGFCKDGRRVPRKSVKNHLSETAKVVLALARELRLQYFSPTPKNHKMMSRGPQFPCLLGSKSAQKTFQMGLKKRAKKGYQKLMNK